LLATRNYDEWMDVMSGGRDMEWVSEMVEVPNLTQC
jgi:ubiquinone/menaquinone biosynthesis C-methylase UbiE